MAFGYIAKLDENVTREHVRLNNRYGIAIAADLYRAKDLGETEELPALIVGAPYGGVKEQGPCVYANELAQRGFVALTFDQVYMGESGGEPRNISSPELFAESFSAAVDYLGVKVPYVDRERIGAIGICGSGGFHGMATVAAAVTYQFYSEFYGGGLSEAAFGASLPAASGHVRWLVGGREPADDELEAYQRAVCAAVGAFGMTCSRVQVLGNS